MSTFGLWYQTVVNSFGNGHDHLFALRNFLFYSSGGGTPTYFFSFIHLDGSEQQWGSIWGPVLWTGCYRAWPAAQPTAAATEQGYPCKQFATFPQ